MHDYPLNSCCLRTISIIGAQLNYAEIDCVYLSAQDCGNLPEGPAY